ncbi:hypothetical protein ABMD26_002478 [Pseudomonas sp. PvP001]
MNTSALGLPTFTRKPRKNQTGRFACRLLLGLFADVGRQCTPLLDGQIEQIQHTKPLDGLERRGGRRQHGSDARGDDRDLQEQPQLQANRIPVAAQETVLQAAGH